MRILSTLTMTLFSLKRQLSLQQMLETPPKEESTPPFEDHHCPSRPAYPLTSLTVASLPALVSPKDSWSLSSPAMSGLTR